MFGCCLLSSFSTSSWSFSRPGSFVSPSDRDDLSRGISDTAHFDSPCSFYLFLPSFAPIYHCLNSMHTTFHGRTHIKIFYDPLPIPSGFLVCVGSTVVGCYILMYRYYVHSRSMLDVPLMRLTLCTPQSRVFSSSRVDVGLIVATRFGQTGIVGYYSSDSWCSPRREGKQD
jgi:hypothetical protein